MVDAKCSEAWWAGSFARAWEVLAALLALMWKGVAAIGIFANVGLAYVFNLNVLFLSLALLAICFGGAVFQYQRLPSDECSPSVFCEQARREVSERQQAVDAHAAFSPLCPVCWHGWRIEALRLGRQLKLAKSRSASFPAGRRKIEACLWSLDHMFGYDSFRKSVSEGDAAEKSTAAILFFLTWLIGSGVLIGAVIETTLRLASGGWRRWPWLFYNHFVIFGWNDNVPTIIREHIESRRIRIPFTSIRRWAMPERIVVVTDCDFREVRRRLNAAVHGHWLVTATLHCGTYDDESEIKRLHLSAANAVAVLGEMNDPSHDAHVLLVPSRVESTLGKRCMQKMRKSLVGLSRPRVLPMELHLDSFGLYCQLERTRDGATIHKLYGRTIHVSRHNFHESWAKRLFANTYLQRPTAKQCSTDKRNPADKTALSKLVRLRRPGKSKTVHLIIVGFSEMGQALATQAARVAHYGRDCHTYITVFDDEIEAHEREYRALFPRIDEIPDIHWTFVKNVNVGSDQFLREIKGCVRTGTDLTVAVACDDSSFGLKLSTPINNALKRNAQNCNTLLLVRQDIHDRVTLKDEEAPELDCGAGPFRVFGMRDGAGYNAWYRDRLCVRYLSRLQKPSAEGTDAEPKKEDIWGVKWPREWSHFSELQRLRMASLFDAYEEMGDLEDGPKEVPDLMVALHNRWLAMRYLENDGSRSSADDPNMVSCVEAEDQSSDNGKRSREEWDKIKETIKGMDS